MWNVIVDIFSVSCACEAFVVTFETTVNVSALVFLIVGWLRPRLREPLCCLRATKLYKLLFVKAICHGMHFWSSHQKWTGINDSCFINLNEILRFEIVIIPV